MSRDEHLGSFFNEVKQLVRSYAETKLGIIKLQGVQFASKAIGFFLWLFFFLFLMVLILIFCGVVAGFWFSELTGSYVLGFGLATLLLLLVLVLLTLFRKILFVNPLIRAFVRMSFRKSDDETNSEMK
jgi:hypothetical protein